MIKENRLEWKIEFWPWATAQRISSCPSVPSPKRIEILCNIKYYVIKRKLASEFPRPVSLRGVGVVRDLTIFRTGYFSRKGVEKHIFRLFISSTPRHVKRKDPFLYFTLGINSPHSITKPLPFIPIHQYSNCIRLTKSD